MPNPLHWSWVEIVLAHCTVSSLFDWVIKEGLAPPLREPHKYIFELIDPNFIFSTAEPVVEENVHVFV